MKPWLESRSGEELVENVREQRRVEALDDGYRGVREHLAYLESGS